MRRSWNIYMKDVLNPCIQVEWAQLHRAHHFAGASELDVQAAPAHGWPDKAMHTHGSEQKDLFMLRCDPWIMAVGWNKNPDHCHV
jgi:hypothetical protein